MQWRQRNVQKTWCTCRVVILLITEPIVLFYVLVAVLLFCWSLHLLFCFMFLLPSASSDPTWCARKRRFVESLLKFGYLHRAKPGLKSGSKNGFSNDFSISSLKFLQDQLVVSDGTIFVVYKMLVICTFRSFGRQIKCGAVKKNVLSIRFLWAKSRSNSKGLRNTPQTRTRWSISQESRP